MSARSSRGRGAIGVVALLLAALVTFAPLVNATAGPPRAVFLKLPVDMPVPQVALRAHPLPAGGLRLELTTEAFRFTEVCVPQAAPIPVGHAHILVDGVKVASAYQPVVVLEGLAPGSRRITVVLRGQDHRALVGQSGLIMADLTVAVPEVTG